MSEKSFLFAIRLNCKLTGKPVIDRARALLQEANAA